jgi:hypothetical protein
MTEVQSVRDEAASPTTRENASPGTVLNSSTHSTKFSHIDPRSAHADVREQAKDELACAIRSLFSTDYAAITRIESYVRAEFSLSKEAASTQSFLGRELHLRQFD